MSISPAAWSALATGFAAVATGMMWIVQRKTLKESVRPQLVLTGWSRDQDGEDDVITFTGVRNVGAGTALHVYMNSFFIDEVDRPEYVMGTERIPVIAPGDQETVDCPIRIYWKNIPFDSKGSRGVMVRIRVKSWDTLGNCHNTEYELYVLAMDAPGAVAYEILPNVMLGIRRIRTDTAFVLRLKRQARKVPLLRQLIRFD